MSCKNCNSCCDEGCLVVVVEETVVEEERIEWLRVSKDAVIWGVTVRRKLPSTEQ
jgi:hypothetical protein